jgi:hypothetical protein
MVTIIIIEKEHYERVTEIVLNFNFSHLKNPQQSLISAGNYIICVTLFQQPEIKMARNTTYSNVQTLATLVKVYNKMMEVILA